MGVLRIINEPTASALAFGLEEKISEPQHILVYDFGGGTFDVSVLLVSDGNYEVLHIDGDNFLGGDDFDNLIIDEMLEQLRKELKEDYTQDEVVKNKLKGRAEQIKINLSRDEHARVVEAGIAQTRRGIPVSLDYSLTRARFEQMIASQIKKSITITNDALKEAGLNSDDIDRVLLVGGSTRIPLVRNQLKGVFGDKIEIEVDPMQCVALGAAIQTAIPIEWICPNCNTVNEGIEEVCRSCQHPNETEGANAPVIVCDVCGKANRQGRLTCWSCGAKIGALFNEENTNPTSQDNTYIRIGDITSKHLGVEVKSERDDNREHELTIIIPKGTPYPTHESIQKELYTTYAGQDTIEIPVFEVEHDNAENADWEHVGKIINDKIPAGTPVETPVIIEMGIDGDGVLTVTSYLKRMKDNTLISKQFKFGSKEIAKESATSGILDELGWRSTMLKICAEDPRLRKHLEPGQAEQAKQIVDEASAALEAKDEVRAKSILERVNKQIEELPPPTETLFWSYLFTERSDVTAVERSQINQTIMKMETLVAQGNIDDANEQLGNLRELNGETIKKIPENILKATRK